MMFDGKRFQPGISSVLVYLILSDGTAKTGLKRWLGSNVNTLLRLISVVTPVFGFLPGLTFLVLMAKIPNDPDIMILPSC